MYSVWLRSADETAMITLGVSGELLIVWSLRLVHADMTDIKQMMSIKADIYLEKVALQPTRSYSSCVELTMLNTTVKSGTTLEASSGAVLYTASE